MSDNENNPNNPPVEDSIFSSDFYGDGLEYN